MYRKLKISPQFSPLIPYLISVPVCIFLPLAASGGDHLIEAIAEHSFPLSMLVLILAAKIIFTGLSAGSGAIGGIFVPLLSCGALTGIIFSNILVYFNLIEAQYAVNLMVFAITRLFYYRNKGSDYSHSSSCRNKRRPFPFGRLGADHGSCIHYGKHNKVAAE